MIQLHPYNLGSRSAKALKEYLTEHGKRAVISHRLASRRPRMIVGWGAKPLEFDPGTNRVLNHPDATRILSCKKKFFDAVPDENTRFLPCYTDDPQAARNWADTVVVRATTTGSGGDGITIVQAGEDLPRAPLYVKYQKKTHEYRLHVFKVNGEWEIRHVQRKVFVPVPGRPEPTNWQIRNHTMGFIFQTEDTIPDQVRDATLSVSNAFPEVDFIALDVIYHAPTGVALVLEGNTAPGLEGPRLQVYGDYLIQRYEGRV